MPTLSEALDIVKTWDPTWAEAYERLVESSLRASALPPKTAALVLVALSAACTTRDAEGVRQAMQAALTVGANRDELLAVLKMSALLAIHSCSLGAPLLLSEVQEKRGTSTSEATTVATPACDAMRSLGQWNQNWDPFFNLDPRWTDEFMAAGLGIYQDGVLPAKEVELLSIALDASVTHMYAPGVSRHIKGALAAGATATEIMAVLELCVAFGSTALAVGVPILAEELERAKA